MKLRLTRQAQQDLREIGLVIAADNPAACRRVIEAIHKTLNLLRGCPQLGMKMPDINESIRAFPAQSPAQNYVIYFEAGEDLLIIKRVLHGARDAPAVLKE